MDSKTDLAGGCHCRAVRFQVAAPLPLQLLECNCSICRMAGFLHLIVPQTDFRLTDGEDQLSIYRFNTGAARHPFCLTCGIKSFYWPRSHPEGVSVNVHCLDDADLTGAQIEYFDGANWEQAIERLRGEDD